MQHYAVHLSGQKRNVWLRPNEWCRPPTSQSFKYSPFVPTEAPEPKTWNLGHSSYLHNRLAFQTGFNIVNDPHSSQTVTHCDLKGPWRLQVHSVQSLWFGLSALLKCDWPQRNTVAERILCDRGLKLLLLTTLLSLCSTCTVQTLVRPNTDSIFRGQCVWKSLLASLTQHNFCYLAWFVN